MISLQEASASTMSFVRELGSERIGLDLALNRVLAEDVKSDIDMPPFNKAAMDGYACRRADLGTELTVVETIPAGTMPTAAIGPGECAKIMTGAVVPDGADCVFMKEFSAVSGSDQVRFTGENTRDNICSKGEDVNAGDVVLRRGERILAQHVGVLAAAGHARPAVFRQPAVGIVVTGSELVEPAETPAAGQIRNSNGAQLCAQVLSSAGIPRSYGIAADTEQSIDAAVAAASRDSDVILLSGGVSMGDFDLVPGVLKKNGFTLVFENIAVKPGKPTVFGTSPDSVCFGLPGNPVSVYVIFELLVKPFLWKMMGHDYQSPSVMMPLGSTISRKKTARESWLPVSLTADGRVMPSEYHGSAHSQALCRASGLITVPAGVAELPEGTIVRVRQV